MVEVEVKFTEVAEKHLNYVQTFFIKIKTLF